MKKLILIITMFLLALTASTALAQAPEGEEYIVQAGDSLGAIAGAEYSNPQAFPAIVAATNAKAAEDDSFTAIEDPAAIVAGQKLWLPVEPDFIGPPAPAPGERVTAAIELTTNPWLWTSFTDPVQQFDLEDPEAYTVSFNSEGMVNIQADCNVANGTYTVDDNGSLSIEIGPTTLAACPPDSRSDEFIQKLGFVSNFFFENGSLYLDTMADGGTFQLASASEYLPASTTFVPGSPEIITCPETLNYAAAVENEIEGETYECGVIDVPENYADPESRTIELVYVRLFSPTASPASDPLLYLSGGPGGSALSEVAPGGMVVQNLEQIRQSRDVIAYDQRGTGRSNALLCGPTEAAIGLVVEVVPDQAEEIQRIEAEEEDPADMLNMIICAQGYMAAGVDLTNTTALLAVMIWPA